MSRFEPRMTRRTFARGSVAASVALAAGFPAGRAAMAQDELPPLPEGATVVADGLLNPRFLAMGDDGSLYITECGVGGDEVLLPPNAQGTPAPEVSPEEAPANAVMRGYTGQITKVAPDGTQSVLVPGLASYSTGIGPAGIATSGSDLYFAMGGTGVAGGVDPLPEENTVNHVNPETGEVTMIAELGPYEEENNPDGQNINPNLHELEVDFDGRLIACDQGGNTIYAVDPSSGEIEVLVVIPTLGQLPGGQEITGDAAQRQSMPTSLVLGSENKQIGLLSYAWPPSVPSVLSLSNDGNLTGVAGGLAFLVGLTYGRDGQLYGTQLFGPPDESGQFGLGSIVRIYGDGTVETVLDGLLMPYGTAFDTDGNLYIAMRSLLSAPGTAAGQVIRIDGVA